jgi:hypothetical protein
LVHVLEINAGAVPGYEATAPDERLPLESNLGIENLTAAAPAKHPQPAVVTFFAQ